MERIHLLTFSPTGTSRRVGLAIAQGMGAREIVTTDLTRPDVEVPISFRDDPVIIAVPVYGGHVAPLALKRLDMILGVGTPVVPVVVYGNRHYEDAPVQLADFLRKRGFRVVAAAIFVGEHSFSTQEYPVASGRPDAADLEDARAFGRALDKKLKDNLLPAEVDVTTIATPAADAEGMQQFKQTIASWMAERKPMPVCPTVDAAICTACGTCAELCPTEAIDAEHPQQTDAQRCIKCCACVKGCPTGARVFDTPFSALLNNYFSVRKANCTLL